DVRVRQLLLEDLAGPPLVRGVEERPEKRDRDRLDALLAERTRGGTYVVLVQRRHHLPVDRHPLLDDVDPVAWDERRRGRVLLELPRLQAATHVENVAEPPRRHEASQRALAGEYRVR